MPLILPATRPEPRKVRPHWEVLADSEPEASPLTTFLVSENSTTEALLNCGQGSMVARTLADWDATSSVALGPLLNISRSKFYYP